MWIRKILFSVAVSTFVMTVLVASFGARGFFASKELEKALAKLEGTQTELEREGRILNQEFEALLRDPERLRLAARSLGYFLPDERVLVVNGQARVPESPRPPRTEPTLPERVVDFEDGFFRLFWLLLTLTSLAVLETREWLTKEKEGRHSRPSIKGIPGGSQTLS